MLNYNKKAVKLQIGSDKEDGVVHNKFMIDVVDC